MRQNKNSWSCFASDQTWPFITLASGHFQGFSCQSNQIACGFARV